MKTTISMLILVLQPAFAGGPLPTPISEKPPILLGVGEQRILRIPGLERYSIGGGVLKARPFPVGATLKKSHLSNALLIKGATPGITDLWVWKLDGSIEHRSVQVEKVSSLLLKPELARALAPLTETEIIYAGPKIILRGEVASVGESARLAGLLRAYPEMIHLETELTDDLLKIGAGRLEKWLQSSPQFSDLRLERLGRSLWIRGHLENAKEEAEVRRQIRALFPLAEIDLETLPDHSPTVYFRVYLLELKKSSFRSLGLAWPQMQEAAFRATTAAVFDLLQLDLTLNQLEGEGSARVLSRPELVVRAPGEAELFAGGELPIRTQSRFSSTVTWRPYGLTLRLKVTHQAGKRLRLDIFTEVSHLDASLATDQIPGVQANRMKTQVDATYGHPLFLCGLLQHDTREQARGLPGLRSIPVLGTLFGSQDYLHDRSELVAILVPEHAPPTRAVAPFERILPRGPIPLPREWISPDETKALQDSEEYPWNALH